MGAGLQQLEEHIPKPPSLCRELEEEVRVALLPLPGQHMCSVQLQQALAKELTHRDTADKTSETLWQARNAV